MMDQPLGSPPEPRTSPTEDTVKWRQQMRLSIHSCRRIGLEQPQEFLARLDGSVPRDSHEQVILDGDSAFAGYQGSDAPVLRIRLRGLLMVTKGVLWIAPLNRMCRFSLRTVFHAANASRLAYRNQGPVPSSRKGTTPPTLM